MVELFRVGQLQIVLHVGVVAHTYSKKKVNNSDNSCMISTLWFLCAVRGLFHQIKSIKLTQGLTRLSQMKSNIMEATTTFWLLWNWIISHYKLRLLTHKVVVPGDLAGHHEEAQEAVREQHLDSFIVGWQVTFRVVALVCVLTTPLVSAGCQLVGCEGARARGKAERWGEMLLIIICTRNIARMAASLSYIIS